MSITDLCQIIANETHITLGTLRLLPEADYINYIIVAVIKLILNLLYNAAEPKSYTLLDMDVSNHLALFT